MSTQKNLATQDRDDTRVANKDTPTLTPACDVFENADEYLIVAEVPGVEDNHVQVLLDRTRLSIEATRNLGGQTMRGEEASFRYLRMFEVPDTIDAEQINAKLENGVLSVHLPKSPQARVRQITVRSG